MTTEERARQIYESSRRVYGRVPPPDATNVCYLCLGPKSAGYAACNSCSALFLWGGVPLVLRERVVPMSIVMNPSAWYSALQTYKAAQWQEYAPIVGSLAYLWFVEHRGDLAAMLGGDPGMVTIVPSKRAGIIYANQALRRVLVPVTELGIPLLQTLAYVGGEHGRSRYTPGIFTPEGTAVRRERIIVVEDTWTTGATALSACGALIEQGARSVVLVPIARMFNNAHLEEDHPYRGHVAGDHDLTFWPR